MMVLVQAIECRRENLPGVSLPLEVEIGSRRHQGAGNDRHPDYGD